MLLRRKKELTEWKMFESENLKMLIHGNCGQSVNVFPIKKKTEK